MSASTDTVLENPAETVAPLVYKLIKDTERHGADLFPGSSDFRAGEATVSLTPAGVYYSQSGQQLSALKSLAERLSLIALPSSGLVPYTDASARAGSTATRARLAFRPAWRPQIVNAGSHEEVIAVLRLFRLDAVADRLGYLCSLAYDDPDEAHLEIESLRPMALFLMSHRQLRDPQIGVTPNGLMQIEWRLPSNGILAMEFLLSGLIRFAAISAPAQRGVDRLSVNGTLPVGATLEAVRPFTVLL